MRSLLDSSSQRVIKILEVLAFRQDWMTLADLSAAVGASQRTLAHDLEMLNSRWGKQLSLESSKRNGIRLLNKNAASIGLVFSDLFNQSVALCWIKELLFHPGNTLEFYEKKLFTSSSTLNRLLSKINHFLHDREIKIQCRGNRYQLLAKNEQYLRDFSASFLLELHGLNLQEYDVSVDLEGLQQLIVCSLKKNLPPIAFAWSTNDDISLTYQMMFYLISLVRENQGYCIPSDYPIADEVDPLQAARVLNAFPHCTMDNLRPIHSYFYNRFNGWSSDAEKELVKHESAAFINRLFDIIPLCPHEDTPTLIDFVLTTLYLNGKFRTHKTSVLFDRIHFFALSLKRTNHALYQVMEDNIKILIKKTKAQSCAGTSDIIFWLCLTCPELYRFSAPKKALLASDFGKPHAIFLSKVLAGIFNKGNFNLLQVDIAAYPAPLTPAVLEGYDLLFTTNPNLSAGDKPVILISDYPSYNDLCTIYKAVLE